MVTEAVWPRGIARSGFRRRPPDLGPAARQPLARPPAAMTPNPYSEDHLVEREGEERRRLDALVSGCNASSLSRSSG